jgi:hypothetical protein
LQIETINSNINTFRPGPKLAELLQAEVFHGVQVANQLDEDTTLAQFNDIITALQTAMKSRFSDSGKSDHLNWIGFLNLHNWPVKGWRGKQLNFTSLVSGIYIRIIIINFN